MLATSQVLDEGIDVPAANVGILFGEFIKRQYAQRLGRILRPTDENQPPSTRSSPRTRWKPMSLNTVDRG